MKQILLAIVLIALPVAVFTVAYEILAPHTSSGTGVKLGDLKVFSSIVSDVQTLVNDGDSKGASLRITDLETAWDEAEGVMRPLNQTAWNKIDAAIDRALDEIRTPKPDVPKVQNALMNLRLALANPYGDEDASAAQVGVKLVTGIAVTDVSGYPLPCEGMLRTLKGAIESGRIPKAQLAQANELRDRAIERCNADDDRRADEFVAQALSLAVTQ